MMITPSFLEDKKSGYVYFQDQVLSFKESMHIHFKPSNNRYYLNFILFLIDIIGSIVFQIGHIIFFIKNDFEDENDHVLHVLIGAGFTSIMLVYSFSDGVRFLRSNVDKVLYFISCLLQKPLLLPIIMPWRFRSRIATKHIVTHTLTLNTINVEQGI